MTKPFRTAIDDHCWRKRTTLSELVRDLLVADLGYDPDAAAPQPKTRRRVAR